MILPVAFVKTHRIRGRIPVVHPFDEEKRFERGNNLVASLDPRPGSIIFDSHTGIPKKGQPNEIYPMLLPFSRVLDQNTGGTDLRERPSKGSHRSCGDEHGRETGESTCDYGRNQILFSFLVCRAIVGVI